MSTELAIRPDQTSFDAKQSAALASNGVQNAPAADIALLFHQAVRTGLDPFARQIYLIGRNSRQGNQWVKKWSIQTGIDGFRVIRDRKGSYAGHTEEWCGPNGQWRDVWLDAKHPAAARVSVYVKGYTVPVVGVALWTEYVQMKNDEPTALWATKPALMLAKCAEALALRKAFPQDLSGLYTDDEMARVDQPAPAVLEAVSSPLVAEVVDDRPEYDSVIADHWFSAITDATYLGANTDDGGGLRALRRQAKKDGVLDHPIEDAPDALTIDDLMRQVAPRLPEHEPWTEGTPAVLDDATDDGDAA